MGSIIVACILLSKIIVKDRIGVKFQYALWFILILRLLLPFAPSSNISVYNYVPSYVSTDSRMVNIPATSPQIDEGDTANTGEVTLISLEKTDHKSHSVIMLVRDAIPFIWILGMCIIGLAMFINNALFLRRIRKYPCLKDQHVLSILNHCKYLMNIPKNISLVEADIVNTPCVLRYIKPIIIIPVNFLDECNLLHLKYVLLHELAHIKRKDIFVNYLVSFLCIIYWFNPVIWYGFHKMREDREICCDSLALSVLRDEEVINYGFTIIKLAEISSRAPYLPAIAGIINNKSKIERRIRMIKMFKKSSYRLSIIAITVLLITGVAFLTGATRTKADTTDEIIDGVNCTFVDDQDAIGKWVTVDFVKNMEDFTPDVISWQGELHLLSMKLLSNGQMPQPVAVDVTSDETTPVDWLTWTKGYIIHHNDKTAGKYMIKEIDGSKYMFWEWMSGDVTLRGMKPYYYVLKKVE
jgi:bla regulator protein BlaR1